MDSLTNLEGGLFEEACLAAWLSVSSSTRDARPMPRDRDAKAVDGPERPKDGDMKGGMEASANVFPSLPCMASSSSNASSMRASWLMRSSCAWTTIGWARGEICYTGPRFTAFLPADSHPLDPLVDLVLGRARFRIKVEIVHLVDALIVIGMPEHLNPNSPDGRM